MTTSRRKPSAGKILRFGIVGLGPRGLTVLERIIALCRQCPQLTVGVTIFEPNEPGCGTHPRRQPDYLRLNTIACQISMFPGSISPRERQPHVGPSLLEWCLARDVLVEDAHSSSPQRHRPVEPTDFLPRRLLGEYLTWFYAHLRAIAPGNLAMSVKPTCAIDVRPCEGDGYHILGADASATAVDHVFITIGHCAQCATAGARRRMPAVDFAYPLPDSLQGIDGGASIAIRGLGLTAMDVMVALIDKWGGRFTRDREDGLTYWRSGREGKLRFLSRNGRPYCARPMTTADRKSADATFLTEEEVDMRMRGCAGESWFRTAILPLMRLEMIVAYYACHIREQADHLDGLTPADVGPFLKEAWRSSRLAGALAWLAGKCGGFDPDEHLALQAPAQLHGGQHRRWFRDYMRRDIAEARRGLAHSPLKSALEVWRDLRDTLRAIVDDARFTSPAREEFFRDYVPMINRLVAGPQWERSAEFVCLMDEHIAVPAWSSGPSGGRAGAARGAPSAAVKQELEWSEGADCAVDAFLRSSGATRADTALFRNLVAGGIITSLEGMTSVDGIRVTPGGNAVRADGTVNKRVWVFGPAAEGATYYNHYVPAADGRSRAYVDSDRAVRTCFDAAETAAGAFRSGLSARRPVQPDRSGNTHAT